MTRVLPAFRLPFVRGFTWRDGCNRAQREGGGREARGRGRGQGPGGRWTDGEEEEEVRSDRMRRKAPKAVDWYRLSHQHRHPPREVNHTRATRRNPKRKKQKTRERINGRGEGGGTVREQPSCSPPTLHTHTNPRHAHTPSCSSNKLDRDDRLPPSPHTMSQTPTASSRPRFTASLSPFALASRLRASRQCTLRQVCVPSPVPPPSRRGRLRRRCQRTSACAVGGRSNEKGQEGCGRRLERFAGSTSALAHAQRRRSR